ncbi:MAG: dTDP-4-dehydrorhamnose 3,5-epimerase [Deltaproteobacteria bacterium]|nr:dTDP-4-dehydrorhamnose 3,5-epimerase [Deltaproteobacteria bacterium]
MPFLFNKLEIPDVVLIEPEMFPDARGTFGELYKLSDFSQSGIKKQVVQINYSKSDKNVLRGLHYQKNPMAQEKIVRVLSGKILDVAVDLRLGSPFYSKWVGVSLSSFDMKMLYIPEGFAHGFSVLSDSAEIEYLCTNVYSPENEKRIIYNDPALNIDWGLKNPVLSQKDAQYPVLALADNNFVYENTEI